MNIIKKCINRFKRHIYTGRCKKAVASYGNDICINNRSKFTKYTTLGSNVFFNSVEIYGKGEVVVGNNFRSGIDCMILSSYHDYDSGEYLPYGKDNICGKIVISDNVWIGNRVIILSGVTIGEGAIIQAGSVVVSDIPPLSIAGGHPAKVFKKRNEEHYNRLKNEKDIFELWEIK